MEKVDVSKNLCHGERQTFFEMKEGYKISRVKILVFRYLFQTLHISSTVKTSKHEVEN